MQYINNRCLELYNNLLVYCKTFCFSPSTKIREILGKFEPIFLQPNATTRLRASQSGFCLGLSCVLGFCFLPVRSGGRCSSAAPAHATVAALRSDVVTVALHRIRSPGVLCAEPVRQRENGLKSVQTPNEGKVVFRPGLFQKHHHRQHEALHRHNSRQGRGRLL